MSPHFRHCCGLQLFLWLGLFFAPRAFGEISEEKPLHHFFNAQLLQPGEIQLSIFSNVKVGIVDKLELGTNGILDGIGIYNIALKHQMFVTDTFKTSFNSHSFFTNSLSSKDKDTAFLSLHGVITTNRIKEQEFLNWGLMDLMLYIRSATSYNIETVHVPTAVLGMDYVFGGMYALSAIVLKPVLKTSNLESDELDLKSRSNLISDPSRIPAVGMLSFTIAYDVFNLEFNGLLVGHTPMGYINMWWRFQ